MSFGSVGSHYFATRSIAILGLEDDQSAILDWDITNIFKRTIRFVSSRPLKLGVTLQGKFKVHDLPSKTGLGGETPS